ncbi:transglutaminase domain-containing protein [Salinivirga cyanobacteriivorans]
MQFQYKWIWTFTLIVFFSISAQETKAWPGKIVSSYKTPGNIATGLTFDGELLWVADRAAKKLYGLNPDNGKVKKELESPAYWPMGMTWDGEALWNVDVKGGLPLSENYHGVAYRIDPKNGEVLRTVKLSVSKAQGLAWDGRYLWVADDGLNVIEQVNANDGTTIKSFPSPTLNPNGMTFDGKYLWISDRYRDEIYMVSPRDGSVIQILEAPGHYTHGLAVANGHLWAADSEADKIFKLIKSDKDRYRRYNPKKVRVTHTHEATNFGPGMLTDLDIHLAIPTDRPNQDIEGEIDYSDGMTDKPEDHWGQKTAHYEQQNIEPGSRFKAQMTVDATLYEVRYFIDPANVGDLEDVPEDIRNRYLANNEKYQFDHPIITRALETALQGETNPYWMARRLFNYLIDHMYYEMVGGWNTAPAVLERGNGSCSEYTFTYIAMCRAAGIPARYVGSVVIRGDDSSMDDVFHRWAEIYLPGYGWIPVDASRGDKKLLRDQAGSFGYLANRFVITTQSGGGSETMEWTYNSNAFWKTEPKTYVVTDHYADWKPVSE